MTVTLGSETLQETLERMARGIARGEYSLLLGAGASMGALGGNRLELPSGPGLRDALIDCFSIQADDDTLNLSRIYAAAVRKDPVGVHKLLCDWFTQCSPSWQGVLADFQWRRIWTLNVDDVMENVYRERGINADPFDWTSSHRDTHDSPHQIIHLHGFVDRSSTPDEMARKLIFSFSDYASSVSDPQAWHTVFTSEFADLPFIILGATLSEEFDLIQALRSGSNSDSVRGLPSIIVLSSVSDFHRDELNSYGLQVVEADAHTFMQKLKATFQQLQLVLGEEYGHPLTPELSRFLQQFVDLRRYEPIPNADRHDFYAGYEPLWSDIQADDDSIIETTERSFSSITDSFAAEEGSQQIHLLTGRSGTGKSTGLLRIAQHAISQGKSPFIYREDEALDVKATIAWLNAAPNTVLFFDNCGEFAESLMNLATECEATGISLLVIGAERNIRRKHLQDKIAGRFLRMTPDYEYRSLTNRDIEALIVKLDRRGRLGQLTRISQPGRRNYFIREASRLLFVKGGAMKDHRGGEKLCLSHKSCRHSGCRMSARLGTGRIVDAASRDEPRAGLAVTADTR